MKTNQYVSVQINDELAIITKDADTIIATYKNKSNAIRALHDLGYDRSVIARALNVRYQHVRNVLITPLKKLGQL